MTSRNRNRKNRRTKGAVASALPARTHGAMSSGARPMASASGGGYKGAGNGHPVLMRWNPGVRSGHSALRESRERLSARLHDMVRNDGWASAAVTRFTDNIAGTGWRPSAKPNLTTLGMTAEQADEISDRIEALWHEYANDTGMWCDIERSSTMSGILATATRHFFADGECGGWIGWRDESPLFSTAVQIIDPQRICNPQGRPDSTSLKDGVALDEYGAPQGYWVRKALPGDMFVAGENAFDWEYFERETAWGRPSFIHLRDRQWAGMTRSTSPLAPVVTKFRQVTNYDEKEIEAATLNAVLSAFVSTPIDPAVLEGDDQLSAQAQMERDYYGQTPIEVPEGVSLSFLAPGSKIETVSASHPSGNFEPFIRSALRNIASAAGMPYEALTADFSQANYSSIRAALVEFRRTYAARSATISHHWMNQIWRAWLEEVFDRRLIDLPSGIPSFEAAPAAWCHVKWIATAAGWVDPQKEAEAALIRMSGNLSTMEDEVAAQGGDWREHIRQRGRERRALIAEGMAPDAGRPEARIQSESRMQSNSGDDGNENEEAGGSAPERAARRQSSLVPIIPLRSSNPLRKGAMQ